MYLLLYYTDQESNYVTNGVRAELIIGIDGVSLVLGIRVSYRYILEVANTHQSELS